MCDHTLKPCNLNPSHYAETFEAAASKVISDLINTGTTNSSLAHKVVGYDHIWKIHWQRAPGSSDGCCVTVIQCLPGKAVWPMYIKSGLIYNIPNYNLS
uniref:NS7a protein n=1 Tax=Bird deltacoronavirus HKU19 TaxID=3237952 RepID=A0AB39AFS8_9NIDO